MKCNLSNNYDKSPKRLDKETETLLSGALRNYMNCSFIMGHGKALELLNQGTLTEGAKGSLSNDN